MSSHVGEVVDEVVDIMRTNMEPQSPHHVGPKKRRRNLLDVSLTADIVELHTSCECLQNIVSGHQCVKPPVHALSWEARQVEEVQVQV